MRRFAAAMLGMLLAVPPVAADFPVSLDPGEQQDVAAWGDIVVWVDGAGADRNIMGRDVAKGISFTVCDAAGAQTNPSIYGRTVVWQDARSGVEDIYMATLDSAYLPTESVVCNVAGAQYRPYIDGDIIVWDDTRPTGGGIYAYRISTATEFPVSTGPSIGRYRADVSGDTIIWSDHNGTDWDILGYDIPTATIFPVVTAPGHQNYAKISDGIVVWNDKRDGYWDLRGYDVASSVSFTVFSAPGVDSTGPEISHGLVIWEDHRFGGELVYAKDLARDIVFRVTPTTSTQHDPDLYRGLIAWQDDRNGEWDIYAQQIPEPASVLLLGAGLAVLGFIARRRKGNQREAIYHHWPRAGSCSTIWREGRAIRSFGPTCR